MHKALMFFGILAFSTVPYAQSEEETVQWLIEQTKPHDLTYVTLEYSVVAGDLKSLYYFSLGETKLTKSVALSKVTKISHVQTDKYLSFSLMCDNKDDCARAEETERYSDKFVSESANEKFLFEIYRKTDKSLAPRIQKALLHLIELNGGKAKAVPHVARKEAF
jgi:hypothetical protein